MAQNISSTLVGQVNDRSGRGVARANIVVTNIATGISFKGAADSSGFYSVAGLGAGTYSLAVEATGFAIDKENGIVLQSSQTVRVDIALKLGAASQTVTVNSSAPLIETDSAAIGGTADEHQITDLPSSYQSVVSLYAAIPGTANPSPSSPSNPQIAGTTHWGAVNYSSNGVSLNDPVNGGAAYAYANGGLSEVNLPGLDTLQEFQVTDVNSNAEYRNVASVLMVTKQGTNKFHGDLFEFFQNAYLNANSYALNAAGLPRSKGNINQFGGSIGGPIYKNKAFFFFSPTYLRQIVAGTAQLTLPSVATTKGDFSALGTQLYNPYTGLPFAGNKIPAALIAPQATALLKYLPSPTNTASTGLPNGGINYISSIPFPENMDGYVGRFDYQVNHSDSIYGFYSHNIGAPWTYNLGGPPTHGNATNYGYRDQAAGLTETHVFSPTALNDFRAAWVIHTSFRIGQNQDLDPSTLFPQLTTGANRGTPTMSASGYSSITGDVGNNTHESLYDVEFTDNFTKVLGNHSFKAGVDETGYKDYKRSAIGSLGSFAFSGVWTGNGGWPGQPSSQGNAFADFLLGTANSASKSTISPNRVVYNRDYEVYGQDTWQATSHLTLYYGLRYMYQTPWNAQYNSQSLFDLTNNKIALPQDSATPVLPMLGNPTIFNLYSNFFETTQSIGLPSNFMHPSKRNWAPRFGFAFRPLPNTVLRGGYGIYYNYLIEALAGQGISNLPFGNVVQTASSSLGKPTAPYQPDVTFQSPFGSAVSTAAVNPTATYVQPDLKNAMTQQWSLTLERQFLRNWMARASYVGSQTQHISWLSSDINQPLVQIPSKTLQQQRPRQPWGAINSERSGAVQSFHQLQLETIKRYTNGMSFQAEYSWTRSLDDVENSGGPQRFYFPKLDYGNSSGVRTHNLTFNYLYALPIGRGMKWLNSSSELVNLVAGGWRLSGITNYATGAPFSVAFSVPSNYIGWLGGRADRIPGVPLYAKQSGHNVTSGVQWYNPAAFGPPQPWTWGNSGRNILWSPGTWNWDMSALKDFPVYHDRIKTTLRADFINAFNHMNLGAPGATVSSTAYGGTPIPTAGEILSGGGGRTVQVGLRVSF